MNQDLLIAILGDRPIAYHPIIARAVGSVNAGVFLSQLLYWQGKGRFGEWTYKTQAEFEEETGLSRYEQETARKMLGHLGIVEEERRDVPAKLFYRVNIEKLQSLLVAFHNQECGKPAIKKSSSQQTILTETTTETTKDIAPKEPAQLRAAPLDASLSESVPAGVSVGRKCEVVSEDNRQLTPAGQTNSAQGLYFRLFGRKRWNEAQRDLFAEMEAEVGPEVLCRAIRWAAELNRPDLHAIHTTAKKMKSGSPSKPVDGFFLRRAE